MENSFFITIDGRDVYKMNSLNRSLFLYFDKMYFDFSEENNLRELASSLSANHEIWFKKLCEEIEFLEKKGKIIRYNQNDFKKDFNFLSAVVQNDISMFEALAQDYFKTAEKYFYNNYTEIQKGNSKELEIYLQLEKIAKEFLSRIYSIGAENRYEINCKPVLRLQNQSFFNELNKFDNQHSTLKVIFKKFPVLTSETSWESIIEFKQNEDSISTFLALRDFINHIATSNLKEKEIEENIDYLLNKYRTYLKIYKLDHDVGAFQIITTTTLKVIENIASFKFSDAAKSIFDVFKGDILLMKAQQNAPGQEVAYIDRVVRSFNV